MGKVKDLTGQVFGELVVIKRVGMRNTCVLWQCKCSCGKTHEVISNSLLRGACKSCGCHGKEGTTMEKQIYNNYKSGARSRGYSFELSRSYLYSLLQGPCYYCGSKDQNQLKNWYTQESHRYNGIDRKDNSLGYTEENTVSCCSLCNLMKHTNTESSFLSHCELICKYQRRLHV